jgi:hypothetical protein
MSAWDAAGIVLGALPLVIEGLDAYSHSSVGKMIFAKRDRKEFVQQLREAQTGLRVEIWKLCRVVDIRLRSDQWGTFQALEANGSEFSGIWRYLLETRPRFVETSTGAEISYILEDMEKILQKVVKHAAVPGQASSHVLLNIIRQCEVDPTFNKSQGLYNRFMFSRWSTRRQKLIERMGRHIDCLRKLNEEQSEWTLPEAPSEQIEAECSYLQEIRDECISLYKALSEISECHCHQSPTALLKLQKRKSGDTTSAKARFSLILTLERLSSDLARELREVQVSSVPRSALL